MLYSLVGRSFTMHFADSKRILFLYLSLPLMFFCLYSYEVYLHESDHLKQQKRNYEFYNERLKIEDQYLFAFDNEINQLLNDFDRCDQRFVEKLEKLKYLRPTVTEVYLEQDNGALCSNNKHNKTGFKYDANVTDLQFAKGNDSVALIKRDQAKRVTLIWVISFRSIWSLTRFTEMDPITVEYALHDQFLLGIDHEGYYLSPKMYEGKEMVQFDNYVDKEHREYPLKLNFYHPPERVPQWDINAYFRIFFLFSLYVVLCLYIINKINNNLGHQIKKGVRTGEFKAHFQPIVNMRTGKWVGAEALIRWFKNGAVYKYPDQFIPYAEEQALSADFTRICLKESSVILSNIYDDLFSFISINLAPNDLNAKFVRELLAKYKNSHVNKSVELEITERGINKLNFYPTSKFIKELNDTGFRISLDDFGTGQSGLNYISKLSFDKIKIDKCFVSAINTNSVNAHLLTTIVDLAKKLNVELVAEGVETKEQVDWLIDKGIYLGQGWYFERDLDAKDFILQFNGQLN